MDEIDPRINNKEIVGRALDYIQTSLQTLVIAQLRLKYHDNWWNTFLKNAEGVPSDVPKVVDNDDTARVYMDISRICKLILNHRELDILDEAEFKSSKQLLNKMRDVRNLKSHFGKENYTADQAEESINILKELDNIIGLGVDNKLKSLVKYIKEETKQPDNSSMPAPEDSEEIIKAEEPGPLSYDIGKICTESSHGMYLDLEEKQKNDRSSSRFIADASYEETDGVYRIKLKSNLVVDDYTGVIIDGIAFTGGSVKFDGYDKDSRTATMYPGQELKKLLEDGDGELQLFNDMKWLVRKTEDFFEEFGDMISYPPRPQPFSGNALLSKRFEDMTGDQKKAVRMSLTAPLSYVWGVPGSGKTQYVLARAINECISRGERVAVIAPTNLSLEQVLYGLMNAFEKNENSTINAKKDVIRIGNPTAAFIKKYASICENRKIQNELLDKKSKRAFYSAVLCERRYDRIKESVESALKYLKQNPKTEKTSERLYELLKPLKDAMNQDPRFKANTFRMDIGHIYGVAKPNYELIYGRDRSRFLEGDITSISDERLDESVKSLDEDIKRLLASDPKADINSCKVIAMTLSKFIISYGPESTNGRSHLKVDHIFVDEAGYCNVAQVMSLFTMGVPITMLGDHMQLPPVCEIDDDDLKEKQKVEDHRYDFLWGMSGLYADSLFESSPETIMRLFDTNSDPEFKFTTVASLVRTHRFGQNLANVLGNVIYQKEIISASENETEIEVIDASIESFPKEKGIIQRKNVSEARKIARYIKNEKPQDYVVLTPYNAQARLLRNMDEIPYDHVLTIHSSQGREWDTVIISVCDGHACGEEKAPRFTSTLWNGGIEGKRVINTALSRAKKKLVIVCDKDYWEDSNGELIGEIAKIAKKAN